ncbi:insulinase family protein [Aureibaculum sp. A20]|uniref:Insulinase family protein n=1 Tax=Aureibaculum flavum TaxID=2795986 RepID=A0ABS0WRY0_9FLAO|nr:pitrilysin family protein [Aureibaculum flavum]MBJ2174681.1 insulinase family protein [Aureibaculum flavum]
MKNKILIIIAFFVISLSITAQIDRSKMPVSGPTPTINIGKPYTFQLKNGLTVLVVENNKLPRVSFSLSMDNASHAEGDKAGVSSLVATLLGNGSKTISKDAFNEEIDFLGASINFGSESGYASSLSKYTNRILELFSDAALNPNFTQEELDAEKVKLIEGIKSGENSAAAVASRVNDVLAYGKNHPYGEYITEETINNVSLNDIESFYKDYFKPNNAYLVISGDIKAKTAKKLISKAFKKWTPSTISISANLTPTDLESSEIDFIDMPNAVQSELAIMNLAQLKMADEDHFSALIANYILGGAFGSYLNMNLREEHAYTYGARSSLSRNKRQVAQFIASTKVRNMVTDSAVVEMLKEIKRIKTTPVSDEDLKNAKAKYLGSFIMALENPRTIASYAVNIKTQKLPENFYETYIAKINAVTKEDIQRVANTYFKLDKARIVIVGKGSEVANALENISFDGKKIPVKYFDKYANAIEKPVFEIPIPDGVTAATVMQKYIDAIGGKEKLKNVKSVVVTAKGEMQGMTFDLETKTTADNKFAMDLKMAGNSMSKQVFDGEKGYMVMQGQKMDIPATELKSYKAASYPFPEMHYQIDSISLEKIEIVDGKKAFAIKVSKNMTNFYDMESGLKIKQVTTTPMGEQALGFENYKEIEGVQFPYLYKQAFGPQSVEFIVSEIKINSGIGKNDFK